MWDILTGHLIDALRFSSQCLSVAASSTGEFLATTHDDSVGIYLWTNRTLFTHVPHRMLRMSDVAEIDVTDVFGERPEALLQAKQTLENDTAQEEDLIETIQSTSDQLSSELQTLSLVPRARWQTLLHLELIRQRNKPVAPPEKSKTAPFFLPLPPSNPEQSTDIGKSNGLAVNGSPANIPGGASRHRVVQMADRVQSYDNQLSSLLQESRQFANHEPVIVYLSALPSSAADLAIRSLSTSPPYDGLISLIEVFTASLMSRRNYEMIQVWIAVFLRIHGDLIAVDAGLSNALKAFRDEHVIEQKRLGQLASYCSGVSTFVRGGLA